jgi:hypothetical protein
MPCFCSDAVEHASGVKGARDIARPLFALEQPAQEDGVYLVRIDEIAVLIDGADAISVTIGREAGGAFVLDDGVLKGADMRLDRLGIDAGKKWIVLKTDLDVIDAELVEDAGKNAAAGAVHAVDGQLHAGLCDQVEVGEFRDGIDIGSHEIFFGDGGFLLCCWQLRSKVGFNFRDDRGATRTAIAGLVLHTIPLEGVVAGSDHDAAGCARMQHGIGQGRGGRDAVGEAHGNAGGRRYIGDNLREVARAKTRIVTDADAVRGILILNDVLCDGAGGNADVGIGEVIGDEAAPAVGPELDSGLCVHAG